MEAHVDSARRRAPPRLRSRARRRRPARARSRGRACGRGRGRRAPGRTRPARAIRLVRAARAVAVALRSSTRPWVRASPRRSATPRRALARSSRTCWCRRRAVAGDVLGRGARQRGQRAGAIQDRAAAVARQGGRAGGQRLAGAGAVERHRGLGGVRRASSTTPRRRRRSACGRCGGRRWPRPARGAGRRCGTASRRRRRTGRRASRRRERRRSPRPRRRPRGLRAPAAMRGAACRSCTGAKAHTSRPAQPRRRRPASTSSRALPRSPVTTPIERGRAGIRRFFCGSNRPSACELLAQPRQLGEQVAFARDPQVADREGEGRRGGAAAGVVVGTARHDDLGAVGERPGVQAELLEVLAPHRARHGADRVAQLEVDAHPALAEVPHLAEQLHPRPLAQLVAQHRRVAADRERAGAARCPGSPRGRGPAPQATRSRAASASSRTVAARSPPGTATRVVTPAAS